MSPNQQKQEQVREKILEKHLHESSNKLDFDETLSDEVKERIVLINALMVQIFLDSKDIETHNLLPYIRYLVKRFKLDGLLCEFDILIETYTIAVRKTREGYVIRNRPAWFKSTAFYIINNLNRELKKQDLVKSKVSDDQSEGKSLESCDESSDKIRCIIKAFENLREEERYLLNLRIVEGLTWSDIAKRMISEGKETVISERLLARLRKRHQRALGCLRRNYEDLA